MQLLISIIATVVLGAGAFIGLGQHPNTLVKGVHSQTEVNAEVLSTASPTPSASPTPTPSPTIKTNNGLHLGLIRGRHLGEGQEELHENEEAEEHENEHSNPTPTPTATLSAGIHVEKE